MDQIRISGGELNQEFVSPHCFLLFLHMEAVRFTGANYNGLDICLLLVTIFAGCMCILYPLTMPPSTVTFITIFTLLFIGSRHEPVEFFYLLLQVQEVNAEIFPKS